MDSWTCTWVPQIYGCRLQGLSRRAAASSSYPMGHECFVRRAPKGRTQESLCTGVAITTQSTSIYRRHMESKSENMRSCANSCTILFENVFGAYLAIRVNGKSPLLRPKCTAPAVTMHTVSHGSQEATHDTLRKSFGVIEMLTF